MFNRVSISWQIANRYWRISTFSLAASYDFSFVLLWSQCSLLKRPSRATRHTKARISVQLSFYTHKRAFGHFWKPMLMIQLYTTKTLGPSSSWFFSTLLLIASWGKMTGYIHCIESETRDVPSSPNRPEFPPFAMDGCSRGRGGVESCLVRFLELKLNLELKKKPYIHSIIKDFWKIVGTVQVNTWLLLLSYNFTKTRSDRKGITSVVYG